MMIYRYCLHFWLLFVFCFFLLGGVTSPVWADTPTPTPGASDSEQNIRNTIRELEGKISDLKGQERSLSSDITLMDSQVKLAELKIGKTKKDIADLQDSIDHATDRIAGLESSLDETISIFMNRIVATYKAGTAQPLQLLMSSQNLSDLIKKESYLQLVQSHDRAILYQMQNSKMNFADQKKSLEEKQQQMRELKAELEIHTQELAQEKTKKQKLLTETQGSEANYQKLLANAKAQLAGFNTFVASQGGAGLLSGQTHCDDWGCYYNQRDTQWGGMSLNGTKYTIASDGCLVTSMAMVMTHYNHKTTPIDINVNSGNFASYYPAYLLYTITANGVTAERVGATIDSALSNKDPVVVGVHAYGGTHFIVLTSGSKGNYKMHDPYIENGHDINFSDHYSMGSIFEVSKVIMH